MRSYILMSIAMRGEKMCQNSTCVEDTDKKVAQ